MAGENTLQFTDSAFDQDVLNSEVPVLVDFWAPWCGPCKAMSPTVDALASEYAGKVKIGKLNTDENPATAMRYQVRGIPTLLLFKGGKVVDQRVGAMPKPEVQKMIEPHVGAAGPIAVPSVDRSAKLDAPAESSQPAQPVQTKP